MIQSTLIQSPDNHFQYNLHILKHFIVPEPENPVAFRFEPCRAFIVICDLFPVLPAVDFYDQLSLLTNKIHYVFPDRLLPPKLFLIGQPVTKTFPQL